MQKFSMFCALASAAIVVYLLQSGWFDTPDYAEESFFGEVSNFVDGLIFVGVIVGWVLAAFVYFKQKCKEDK